MIKKLRGLFVFLARRLQLSGQQTTKRKTKMNYELLTTENAPVKMWTKGVPVEADARHQLINTAKMPFIFKHIAVMPDVHLGKGSTIGSVIPTKGGDYSGGGGRGYWLWNERTAYRVNGGGPA